MQQPASPPQNVGQNQTYLTTIAVVFAITMSIVAITLRILARKVAKYPLGADDLTIVLGALFTIANAADYLWSNKYGNGKHMNSLQLGQIDNLFLTFFISYQLYALAVTFIKISVLLFYRRIFAVSHLRARINIVGIFVIAWYITTSLLSALQCTPVRKAWRLEVPGHCIDPLAYILGIQAVNVVLDIVVLAIPISIIYHLHMPRSKKIGVAAIFFLGAGSIVMAIARMVILAVGLNDQDFSYGASRLSIAATEPAIEILSACLPVMAPFLNAQHSPIASKFYSRIRSLFSISSTDGGKTSENSNKRGHGFQEIDQGMELASEPSSSLSRHAESEASDRITLRQIVVQKNFDVYEERDGSR